jgi:hypothetical protein
MKARFTVKRACSVLRTRLIGPIGYANDIDFLADLLVNSFANLFAIFLQPGACHDQDST